MKLIRSISIISVIKSCSPPKNLSATAAAVKLEMAIGVTAFIEKCLSKASWAKIKPAIGALNPADIAAAVPQPMKTSVLNMFFVKNLILVPKVAPKCTSGPYWPTDAPPPALIKAAKVEKYPVLMSISLSVLCAP